MSNDPVKVPEGTMASLQSTVEGGQEPGDVWVAVTPTQVRRPWRATARTLFAGLIAAAALVPVIVENLNLDPAVYPWVGTVLLLAATVTRIMAIPGVEKFLQDFVPWLSAAPPQTPRGGRRRDDGASGSEVALYVIVGVAVVWFLLWLTGPGGSFNAR